MTRWLFTRERVVREAAIVPTSLPSCWIEISPVCGNNIREKNTTAGQTTPCNAEKVISTEAVTYGDGGNGGVVLTGNRYILVIQYQIEMIPIHYFPKRSNPAVCH
jgi:hypothetical protein